VTSPRPSGPPPYFSSGQQILWHYRRPRWQPGEPQFVIPGTVVRDDAEALVVWVPAGTPYLLPARANGRPAREDKTTMFTAARVQSRGVWRDYDTLRVAPTGVPWSVWLFWTEGQREFCGWYVNLEDPHRRDGRGVYSGDHILDLELEPDGTCHRKDEDELRFAVEQGRYTADEARVIESHAERVEKIVADRGFPFDEPFQDWRPDPSWPLPPPPYPHL
jgi:predicted RNA-binding protein associated with RNAse of E/G family